MAGIGCAACGQVLLQVESSKMLAVLDIVGSWNSKQALPFHHTVTKTRFSGYSNLSLPGEVMMGRRSQNRNEAYEIKLLTRCCPLSMISE